MDRLSALIVIAALGACDKKAPDGEPAGRVNAAKTGVKRGTTPEAFCDVYHPAASAPAFTGPPGPALAPAPTRWRWINIWATWCKPCLDEMPRLVKWRDKLGVQLTFVSVDESDADLEAFRKLQPATPETVRLDQAAADQWLVGLGLDANAPIPIHIFVDPAGKLRCARAGGVNEPDLAVVEKLLAE